MPEPYVKDRIIFSSKQSQKKFLLEVIKFKDKNIQSIADEWKVSRRTLFDWIRVKRHMPYNLAKMLAEECGVRISKGAKRLIWQDHAKQAGIKGSKVNMMKNGGIVVDEGYRKLKWREWWEVKGRFIPQKILEAKEIKTPKLNAELAEFVGIMLGDGSVSSYRISISLNKNEIVYAEFIVKLIEKLFGTLSKISLSKIRNGLTIIVQRKKLVDFLQTIGLPKGNKIKNCVNVPKWIMENSEFQRACVRGLIDTDGCIFTHIYKSNGKTYKYQKIDFTSSGRPLLDSAYQILINLGFSARMTKNQKALRIESQKDVEKYLKTVGTSNPRYELNK